MIIERLHSDYQEEERLYSTGNDELDDLLERAFCEGYEYAQREFTGEVKRRNKELKRQWEAAQGKPIKRQEHMFKVYDANNLAETDIKLEKAGGTDSIIGGKRSPGERVESSGIFGVKIPKDKASTWKDISVEEDAINRRKYRNAREYNKNLGVNNVHDSINKRAAQSKYDITDSDRKKYSFETEGEFKERLSKAQKEANERSIKRNKKLLENHPKYLESLKENAEERVKNKNRKKLKTNILRKGKKAALIGVPVAAAAVGTRIAIKKHKDKKKKEQE